jgi:hypothetical protein
VCPTRRSWGSNNSAPAPCGVSRMPTTATRPDARRSSGPSS